MSTLDRYISRQLIFNVLILLLVLFSFVVVVDVSINLQRYIAIAQRGVRTREIDSAGTARVALVAVLNIFDLWWPRLLQLYNSLIPLVLCGAVGFTYVQMVRHREVVAALAGGISLYRLARPVFLVATLFIGLQIVNQELVIPRIAALLSRSSYSVGQREFNTIPLRLVVDGQRRLFLARSFDPNSATLTSLNVWERDESGKAQRRITADSAVWKDGSWRLANGRVKALSIGSAAANAADPRLPPAAAIASIATDLDPTTILAERSRAFSRTLSWSQVADVLAMPNLKPMVRDQMMRIGLGRVSVILCSVLTLVMVLPFFLIREPRNMLMQTLKAAPIAIIGVIGTVLGTSAVLPGVPAENAVFIPVLVLAPLAVGMGTSVRT